MSNNIPQFKEVEGGKYNKHGFYYWPDGCYWDCDGIYFDKNGKDKHGGHYDEEFNYHPGEGWVESLMCYEEDIKNGISQGGNFGDDDNDNVNTNYELGDYDINEDIYDDTGRNRNFKGPSYYDTVGRKNSGGNNNRKNNSNNNYNNNNNNNSNNNYNNNNLTHKNSNYSNNSNNSNSRPNNRESNNSYNNNKNNNTSNQNKNSQNQNSQISQISNTESKSKGFSKISLKDNNYDQKKAMKDVLNEIKEEKEIVKVDSIIGDTAIIQLAKNKEIEV